MKGMMRRCIAVLVLLLTVVSAKAEDLGGFMMHHISNSHEWKVTPWGPTLNLPEGWKVAGVDMSISLHVFLMLVAAALLVLLLIPATRRKGLAPANRAGNILEILVLFVRDEVVKPNLGEKDTPKWSPFFLTLFFFLLTLNFLSLIPGVPAVGGNINFTATMALIIFIVYNAAGIARNGGHYFSNLFPKGLPVAVLPLIVLIEILGLFTKAFALAIRLFANMTAGHVLILSLLGLIVVFKSYAAAGAFVPFTLFIYLIEILVAFLQAYVFTLLASLFVGMAVHQEH